MAVARYRMIYLVLLEISFKQLTNYCEILLIGLKLDIDIMDNVRAFVNAIDLVFGSFIVPTFLKWCCTLN